MNRREFFQRTVGTTIGAIVISKAAAQPLLTFPGPTADWGTLRSFGIYRDTGWVALIDDKEVAASALVPARLNLVEHGEDVVITLKEAVTFAPNRSGVFRPAVFLENDPTKPVWTFECPTREIHPGDVVTLVS
jgi:hypothetical protein